MKRYFWLFGSFFLLIFLDSPAFAQDEIPHGSWSVAAFGGINYSVASSMHGSIEDYTSAIGNGTTASRYPFGSNHAHSLPLLVQLSYRYAKSPFGLFIGASGSAFNAGSRYRFSEGGRYTLTIGSADAGVEYTFGQLYQHWNFFGRFGIISSVINTFFRERQGTFSYDDFTVSGTGSRFGLEIEIGERYNIIRSTFGIEASLNYTNINMIGKSYTKPVIDQGFYFGGGGNSGDINDGKNPDDANDNARVIDYLSLRVGARYYF